MLKLTKVLAVCFLLFSCSSRHKAHPQENAFLYEKVFFDNWKTRRPKLILLDEQQLIKVFNAEKNLHTEALDLLPRSEVKKAEWLYFNQLIQKGEKKYKSKLFQNIKIDEDYITPFVKKQLLKEKNKPVKKRLYQIYLKYPTDASLEEKSHINLKMIKIKNWVKDLNSFKEMAQKHSDSTTRLQNGLIGNVKAGFFPKQFDKIFHQFKAGEISEIIKTADGLMIFFCESIIKPKIRSYDELYKIASKNYKNSELNQEWEILFKKIINQQKVKIQAYHENDMQSVFIQSKDFKMTFQELFWLFPSLKNTLVNTKKVKDFSENWVFRNYLFKEISKKEDVDLDISKKAFVFDALVSKIIDVKIKEKFNQPSSVEMKKYWLENRASFYEEEAYQIQSIAMKFEENSKQKVFDKAYEVYQAINNSELSFSEASRKFSDYASKYPNGDLPKISKSDIFSVLGINLGKQLKQLKINQISKPTESEDNYFWILRIENVFPQSLKSYESSEKDIKKLLEKEQVQSLKNEIIQSYF